MTFGRKQPRKPAGQDNVKKYLEQLARGGAKQTPQTEKPEDAGGIPQPIEGPKSKPAVAEFTPDERRLIWAMVTTMTDNAGLGVQYLMRTDAPGISRETASTYVLAKEEYEKAKKEGMEKARNTPFRQAREQLIKEIESMHERGDKDTARALGRTYFEKSSGRSAMNTLLSERAQKALDTALSVQR